MILNCNFIKNIYIYNNNMNEPTTLALIGILPAVISAIVSYTLAIKKLQVDSEGKVKTEFNKLSSQLKNELKQELDECRKDREILRKELDGYKKQLDTYKEENKTLKTELDKLESKLESANEVIKSLINKKAVKIK